MTAVLAGCAPGTGAVHPALQLLDAHGAARRPLDVAPGECHVLLFISVDCPIANAFAPEIARLAQDFGPRRARFFLVHTDPQVTPRIALRHADEYGLQGMRILFDSKLKLADFAQAQVTPTAAVVDDSRRLVYHGRIDDRFADYGVRRDAPTRRELRDAIQAVLNGGVPAVGHAPAIGCVIQR
jgi:hypothetical protein